MNNIFAGLIALAALLLTGFLIVLILELKKTYSSIRNTIENDLKITLEEIRETLKSIRNISENVNDITSDMKTLSGNVRDVGQNIKHVSSLVENVTSVTAVTASGLRAGIKAAMGVILNNLFSRKGG